jgi:hypothetical protein
MRRLFLACVLASSIVSAAMPLTGAVRSHTVLVIFSNERSLPANLQIDEKLRETLAVDTSLQLTYQTEFLDYPAMETSEIRLTTSWLATFFAQSMQNNRLM